VPAPARTSKKPAQDRQVLADLRAGLDRGGVQRTWQEVGDLQGISSSYARRVVTRKVVTKVAVVRIDPRVIVPEFAELMSDEDVERWNDDPRCLCGCEEATLQELTRNGKSPRGAYRLFRGAHEKRMPWGRIRIRDWRKESARRRRLGATRREQNVQTAFIAGLLNDWRDANQTRDFEALAILSHLSESHLRDIASGRHARIQKKTAGKILAALKEPMRPEIFEAYKKWAISKNLPWEHARVWK
jgi:hypothetical protein